MSRIGDVLVLSEAIASQIEREGVAAYPNECCGILVGRDVAGERIVDKLIPMKNVFDAGEQYHRFSIDPLALAAADEDASKEGRVVLGFYHSHPDHPARPSEYDRTHVPPWNFYSHVIVAIANAKPVNMTCWRMDEESEQFEAEEIERGNRGADSVVEVNERQLAPITADGRESMFPHHLDHFRRARIRGAVKEPIAKDDSLDAV